MIPFTVFLRDLFCIANAHLAAGGAGDGRAFEQRIERYLVARGVRPVELFSGVRSLGSQSLSGLYHQIDATGRVREAVIIGEWKAYHGTIPKNDLMRFKAATDDYWLAQHQFATGPVIRVFGGTGRVAPALRRYAAQWGICLLTTDRWPAPLLASEAVAWPDGGCPDAITRRHLAWLSRPLGAVCIPQSEGGWLIPRLPSEATLDHFLTLHDRWSEQLWHRFDGRPGSFEAWVETTIPRGTAA